MLTTNTDLLYWVRRRGFLRRARQFRDRLDYHRRRMKLVGRKRKAGQPLDIRGIGSNGVPYLITGLVRGSAGPADWSPVLECDIRVAGDGVITVTPPADLRDFVEVNNLDLRVDTRHRPAPPMPPPLTWWEMDDLVDDSDMEAEGAPPPGGPSTGRS
jgi:hypothetical protein